MTCYVSVYLLGGDSDIYGKILLSLEKANASFLHPASSLCATLLTGCWL